MRFHICIAIIAATVCQGPTLSANDDLFSELAMESVFEAKSSESELQKVAKRAESSSVNRVTGISALTQIVKAAELKHTVEDNEITVRLESAGWAFPVKLTVDVERERIIAVLSLVALPKKASIDQDKLIRLMSAGDASQSAFFAFDTDQNLIQLRASLANRNVTASSFSGDLARLARFADGQSELWSSLSPKSASKTQNPPKTATNPKTQPTGGDSAMVGQWTAAVSNTEAFAVQFDGNGRFALVHLKSGKSTTSKGKTIRNGESLALQGDDGTKLNCKIRFRTTKEFALAILDGKGKTAVELTFKRKS